MLDIICTNNVLSFGFKFWNVIFHDENDIYLLSQIFSHHSLQFTLFDPIEIFIFIQWNLIIDS